jgi:hypothetical protein
MKVDYQERIDLSVGKLKIILSEQRTITRSTKNSGNLLVKSWIESQPYRCSRTFRDTEDNCT